MSSREVARLCNSDYSKDMTTIDLIPSEAPHPTLPHRAVPAWAIFIHERFVHLHTGTFFQARDWALAEVSS